MRVITTITLIIGLVVMIALAGSHSAVAGSYAITTLASFSGTNGSHPQGGVVRDAQGNLLGTTFRGGAFDLGTVFVVPTGTGFIGTLASFNGTNGANSGGGLASDSHDNLYGTTAGGGPDYPNAHGTVFQPVAGSSPITTLAAFNGGTNGSLPGDAPVIDSRGNLYGTTSGGGANAQGTVWELAAGSGSITTLASFNGVNGSFPNAGLVLDSRGNMYGTTNFGGVNSNGTVFVVPAGTGFITTLAFFTGANGANPAFTLVLDSQGNLFGPTTNGGAFGLGTVFEFATGTSTLTTLTSFNGANGANPTGSLVLDSQGNLYGTTQSGGANNLGTVFELASGTSTPITLASFNGANGANPETGLVFDSQGNLYGTTQGGGAFGLGTVFEVSPVPEPASVVMLSVSLAAVAGLAWRRVWSCVTA
jgi:uncharacterized repeat protein (TIGR03803 family)